MSNMDKLAKELKNMMTASDNRKPKPYDTQAEVLRVENDIAWVHIPGGVEETPVRLTMNAKKGDMVNIHVASGSAWITGNSTNPPTDDTEALVAKGIAIIADDKSEEALSDASRAKDAADRAEVDAERAHTAADAAQESADDALASSIAANIASNSALTQLSVVEDVASVLTWISEHGTYVATTDTAVVNGKLYFTRSGDEYTLITTPTGNPSTSGYYELDTIGNETVANYISSHLALTSAGLWVLKDNSGYKILLSNTGMQVYDNLGNLVVTYGASVTFADNREFYIGNQNAYILFNPSNNGSITIGGSNITLGTNKTLDEVLAELDGTLIFDTTYTYSNWNTANGYATFTAHVYRGGTEVTSEFTANDFAWYLKTEDGEVSKGNGLTKVFNRSECGYGAEVIAHFTPPNDAEALDTEGNNLTDTDNDPLSVRATGDTVRVRDLTVSTTIYTNEKLMVIGSEDEHLVTIGDMADAFWDKYAITIEDQPLNQGNNTYENIGLLSLSNIELEAMLA